MLKKITRILFVLIFLGMITTPLLATNREENKISVDEKRVLAQFPSIYDEEGNVNKKFNTEFETWFNDNVGFRSHMVVTNARMQYYVFGVLSNNSNMYLGPNGELNYATSAMLADYQHKNLYSKKQLKKVAKSLDVLREYAEKDGRQLYYFQCWDKHSIYPEYFPTTVIQYGEESKTDQIVRVLEEKSGTTVISPKQELIGAKDTYDTYSIWGDATHWTQRGAYIGYVELMEAINAENDNRYRILREEDYEITKKDLGSTLFGGIHREDMLENFVIKNQKATVTNEKLTLLSDDERHMFCTNEEAGNEDTLLIIGDSYFAGFLVDDLAESFHETIVIWGNYLEDTQDIIDEYDPDIIIIEAAERVDRTSGIVAGADAIKVGKE